ncbi:MAG: helix-turn-helix domain-containing protein [Candidatus Eremiobacteraeota bacterium]|nr:helix-turn-helix domain-containing protein [Candidatus Eremiobacteraeota bacterium]
MAQAQSHDFGSLLKRLRLSAGLSQEELAECARLSVEAISAYERGTRRAPYRDTVELLADALAVTEPTRALMQQLADRRRGPAAGPFGKRRENLPLAVTSFVGREREIREIETLLRLHRLVTLTGSGGIGKTRTSLCVARDLIDAYPDGVWFIELAPLASAGYIASAASQALGLALPTEGDSTQNLVRQLCSHNELLLFDNCEHLLEPVGRLIATVLGECPNVKILASSRQPLGIAGEQTYRLPSLSITAGEDGEGTANAGSCEAVKLFADRAQAADHRFILTDDNAPIVLDICRRLDGIPLAIELAAARVKILSPLQLRHHLDERFRVLTQGSRDALPRQRTLRALMDWSHELLDEREKALFRRLGIFANGFTLDGATTVGAAFPIEERDVFELLASLIDKSLVLAEPAAVQDRYRLLESTRIYALERLVAAGEREATAVRHIRYLKERTAKARERKDENPWNRELEEFLSSELEDVRSALEWALRSSRAVDAAKILANVLSAWGELNLEQEGLGWLERVVALLPSGESRLLACLWATIGALLMSDRTTSAAQAACTALEYARRSHDPSALGYALTVYARSAAALKRLDEAEAVLHEAEAIDDTDGALRLRLLDVKAFVASQRHDLETAATLYERLRSDHHQRGHRLWEYYVSINLAEIEHELGHTDRAIELMHDIISELRNSAVRRHLVLALTNLAAYLVAAGRLLEGRLAAIEAIQEVATQHPDTAPVAIAMEPLALTLLLQGDSSRAAIVAAYADTALNRYGFERGYTEDATHRRLHALLREKLDSETLASEMRKGNELSPEGAVALALETPDHDRELLRAKADENESSS